MMIIKKILLWCVVFFNIQSLWAGGLGVGLAGLRIETDSNDTEQLKTITAFFTLEYDNQNISNFLPQQHSNLEEYTVFLNREKSSESKGTNRFSILTESLKRSSHQRLPSKISKISLDLPSHLNSQHIINVDIEWERSLDFIDFLVCTFFNENPPKRKTQHRLCHEENYSH